MYHGCRKGHVDSSHCLIKKGKKCMAPTANCFWKDLHETVKAADWKTKNYRLEKYDGLF